MDHLELDAELDRIRERAQRRYRRRLPTAIAITVVVIVVFIFVVPDPPDHRRHRGVALGIVDISVTLLFIAAMAAGLVRFRRQQVAFWRQSSLLLGLDRPRRKRVTRDIRRGRPSSDPLLRAVEQTEVERLQDLRVFNQRVAPVMVLAFGYWGVRGLMQGDKPGYLQVGAAALLLIAAVWSRWFYRRLEAFA